MSAESTYERPQSVAFLRIIHDFVDSDFQICLVFLGATDLKKPFKILLLVFAESR